MTQPTAVPTPTPAPPAPPVAPAPPAATFTQADLDRIIGERLARTTAELKTAQEKAARWEEFEAASKPAAEQEIAAAVKTAVAEATAAASAKARQEYGGQLVEAHLVAAAAGRLSDTQRAALLTGLDRTRFLTAEGAVDTALITTLIDGLAPAPASVDPAAPPVPPVPPVRGGSTPPVPGGFGQGARPGAPVGGLAAGAAEWDRQHAAGLTQPLIT